MKGMPQISAPPLLLLHWPCKKSSYSVCFHTWLSSSAGCQNAEQNVPKNIYPFLSPPLALRLVNGCAFSGSMGLLIRKADKEETWIPDVHSSCCTALFHPRRSFLKLKFLEVKRQEEEEISFIDSFAIHSLWHLPSSARLQETPLPPPADNEQQRWICSEMPFVKVNLTLKTQI